MDKDKYCVIDSSLNKPTWGSSGWPNMNIYIVRLSCGHSTMVTINNHPHRLFFEVKYYIEQGVYMCFFTMLLVADVSLCFIYFHIVLLKYVTCLNPCERPVDVCISVALTHITFPDKNIIQVLTGRFILPLFRYGWELLLETEASPHLMDFQYSKQLPNDKTRDEKREQLTIKSRSI